MPRTKRKYQHNGIGFDSSQQIFMYQWLLQLKEKNIIQQILIQPESFLLSQKVVYEKKTLLRQHVYTCDFMVKFKYLPNALKPFFNIQSKDNNYFIQIKPSFDMSNMTRLFTINQKWLYKDTGIYVYKFQVDKLFQKTFVPQFCRFTQKTKKLRQKYKDFKRINQFLGHIL